MMEHELRPIQADIDDEYFEYGRKHQEGRTVIKQIFVAECDICGYTEKAKPETFRNETNYRLPDGWMQSEANRQFCICPACWRKLTRHERNGEG